jgi:integrase
MRQRGNDSWELRVFLGTDPETHTRRYATRTVRGSKRAAQVALVELVADASHAPLAGARSTVAGLLGEWVAAASPNWAATTIRQVDSVVRHHLDPHLGAVAVGELTTARVDAFYATLRREGLSAGTVRRIHGVLHAALAQAQRWDWIWINPAANASPPRHVPNEIHPPTPADVALLIAKATASDPAFGTYLRLAASTGARRSQLLALRWKDVDLARGRISFTRALVEGPDGLVLAPTKTRRAYQVSLDADTLTILTQHRHTTGGSSNAFVFSHDSDGTSPWKPNWATKEFIRLREATGIPHCRLHDLRHFMATEMLAAGVAIPIVAARLSHARASTTLNVYAHAVPGGDTDAAEMIGDLLRAPTRKPTVNRIERRDGQL